MSETASETVRVRCHECGKYSELMAPTDDHDGPVVWKCSQQHDDGDLCGATNTHHS